MKSMYQALILIVLIAGLPSSSLAASLISCPAVFVLGEDSNLIVCTFSNHGKKSLDVTWTFYSAAGDVESEQTTNVPINASQLHTFDPTTDGLYSCTLSIRGSSKRTSAWVSSFGGHFPCT